MRVRLLASGVVAVAIAALSVAGDASGQALRTTYVPSGGPVLAGSQVVWAAGRADRKVDLDVADSSTGHVSRLQTFLPRAYRVTTIGLAGSPHRLAAEVQDRTDGTNANAESYPPLDVVQSFAGELGGPLGPLGPACPLTDEAEQDVSVATTDTHVAFTGPECNGPYGLSAAVQDFSQPPNRMALPDGSEGLR